MREANCSASCGRSEPSIRRHSTKFVKTLRLRSAPMDRFRPRSFPSLRSRRRSSTTGRRFPLDEVLDNVTHRSAGTGGVDTLASAADRAPVFEIADYGIVGNFFQVVSELVEAIRKA